ncbi:GMC family oxidoreductase [Nitrospinae bacterium AH_259_B05_G02_I21]|nr:GMC family oxidoreductase [Nitrospinae bacterium AH_259_B05_G02_I21]
MLIDARSLPKDKVIETEVCIVGAGAAGIALAREFVGQEFRVCLLESGSLGFEEDTQALYKGENIGLPYFPLHRCRLRFFGGSTNHWDGWCRPLDAIDFETRDWIPHSGWPFSKSHLGPFYERAQSICQLGPFTYDVKFWENPKKSPRLPFKDGRVITKIYQRSPPTKFGEVYRNEIIHADNISTYLYTNVVDIETNNTAQTVTRVRTATLEGNKFWVLAKLFILATGGIENARLLLLSNKVQSTGLGNQNDLVGRFFMEHPAMFSGVFLPSDPHLPLGLYHMVQGKRTIGALTLAEGVLRREKMVNISATLIPVTRLGYYYKTSSRGVTSFRHNLRATRQGGAPDDFWKHLRNVLVDTDDVATAIHGKTLNPNFLAIRLYNHIETTPNPKSRVTLSDERDRLGQNRARLDWRLSAIDKRSMRRAHEIIGQELGRAGLGRLKVELGEDDTTWPSSLKGLSHHMGTTRMHVDPNKGVVDENCKVHGISNLFIAGSSVFPTSGPNTPTLTIVALAVRLADHVKKLVS